MHAEEEEISTFINCLNDEQVALALNEMAISEVGKLQHFLEEMYESAMFEHTDYTTCEDKDEAEKT